MGDFAQKAYAHGYRAAAMELDDFGNAARWPDFKAACFAHGIRAGCWFTDGGNIVDTPPDADFVIAEHEGPGDYDGLMSAIGFGDLPDCPLGLLTNFGSPLGDGSGYYPEKAKPLINAGFHCLTECYTGDNPNLTKERLEFTATVQLKFPSAQAVYGIYNMPKPELVGAEGVYLAEYEF